MSRTDQQIYKTIAEVVNSAAPAGWRKIIVCASIFNDNGETFYDYLDEVGNQKWFAPEISVQYVVYMAFQELRSMMKTSSQSWDTSRFTLDRCGQFRIEFDYEK